MKKRILTLAVAFALLVNSGTVLAMSGFDSGAIGVNEWNMISNYDIRFKLDGNDEIFLFLEQTDKKNLIVTTFEAYSSKSFDTDGTQKFDVETQSNIGYWLNNDFISLGYTGKALPKSFIDYLDSGYEWTTESGATDGECPAKYKVKAGVALPSVTEIKKYKFGLKDNINPDEGKEEKDFYFLTRTPDRSSADSVLAVGRTGNKISVKCNEDNAFKIRPVFSLSPEFLKSVKLDASYIGDKVRLMLCNTLDDAAMLAAGYTQTEIDVLRSGSLYHGTSVGISLNNESGLSVFDNDEVSAAVTIFNCDEKDAAFEVWCSVDGGEEKKLGTVCVDQNGNAQKNIAVTDLKNGRFNLDLSVKRNNIVCAELSKTINVMQKYEHKFMDAYNPMGAVAGYTTYDERGTNPWGTQLPIDRKSIEYVYYGGFQNVRGSVPFEYINKSLGDDDYSKLWYLDYYKKQNGPRLHTLINGMTNLDDPSIAVPEDMPAGNSPRTQGAIEAYKNRALEYMKVYPEGKRYELWNEANIAFWTPLEGNSTDYPNLLKQTYAAMKKERPDLEISSASTGPTKEKTHITFSEEMFKNGSYPYMDAISYHYYVTGSEVEKNQVFENYVKEVTDVPLKYGGWKAFHLTELGYYNYSGNTELEGAQRLLKAYMFAQKHGTDMISFYCLMNPGTDSSNPEHNYGIMNNDQTPKLAYLAATAFNNELGGAVYVGQLDMGDSDTYGFVYLADGKPVLVTWYYSANSGSKTLNFEGESVTVKDYLGNVKQTNANSTQIGYEYVFVEGLSNEWLKKAVCDSMTEKQNAWLEDYSGVCTSDLLTEAKSVFNNAVSGVSNGESAETIFDSYQTLGAKIIEAMKNGNISQLNASKMTYELYRAAEHLNAYYIATYNGEMPTGATADREKAKKLEAERYLDKGANMQYSASIMNFAERYYEKVDEILNDIENPSKAGAASGYDRMAKMLYAWFEDFSASETADNYYEFYINVKGCDTTVSKGLNKTQTVRFDVVNKTQNDITGYVEVDDDKLLSKAKTESFTVKSGEYSSQSIELTFNSVSTGEKNFTFKFKDDSGNVIKEQNAIFKIE